MLPLGSSHSRLTPDDSPTVGRPGRRAISGQHARSSYGQHPTRVPRPFLDSARWQHETGPWGTQPPHHQTGNADTEPGAPVSRPPQTARHADAIKHAHLTNDTTYQDAIAVEDHQLDRWLTSTCGYGRVSAGSVRH